MPLRMVLTEGSVRRWRAGRSGAGQCSYGVVVSSLPFIIGTVVRMMSGGGDGRPDDAAMGDGEMRSEVSIQTADVSSAGASARERAEALPRNVRQPNLLMRA